MKTKVLCSIVLLSAIAINVSTTLRAQGSRPGATLSATAALAEITKLREDKARLEALLVDRDRQIANLRYQLGKQILELEADLAEARLNQRAEPILRSLRDLVKPDPAAAFDWRTGQFVKPKSEPKPEEKKQK